MPAEMTLNVQKLTDLTSTLIHKREVKFQMALDFNRRTAAQLSVLMTILLNLSKIRHNGYCLKEGIYTILQQLHL